MALKNFDLPFYGKANIPIHRQTYNVPSPNEMVVDTGDYVGVDSGLEKDPVAIINPDNLDHEGDQLQDLPLATDRACPAYAIIPYSGPTDLYSCE